jgi:hypothetical protein
MAHKLAVGLSIFAVIFFTACSLEGDPESLRTIVPGNNLIAKLNWLQDHAASDRSYNIEVDADEIIDPYTFSYSGRSNVTIRLHGDSTKQNVSVTGNGSLFTVSSGVTLILGNNIILSGHSGNDASLVTVYGALVMRKGSLITGNTADNGGGVYVNGGTFSMEDGEIAGNTASSGGGVYIERGKFTKIGGTIYGSDESNGNISFQKYRGHAVYAVYDNLAKRKEKTSGLNNNLSFNSSGPTWSGDWDDEKADVKITLTGMDGWEQVSLLTHTIDFTKGSEKITHVLKGESELITELAVGAWDISVQSFLEKELFAKGSTSANLETEQDNEISIMIYRIGSVSVNIEFTGIPKQTIDLTSKPEDNLYWGETLIVTATEGYDSYTWYLDGNNQWYWNESAIEQNIYGNDYYIGIHSLLVIAVKDDIPYSVELIFKIAYKE